MNNRELQHLKELKEKEIKDRLRYKESIAYLNLLINNRHLPVDEFKLLIIKEKT